MVLAVSVWVSLVWPVVLAYFAALYDADRIEKDGSKDSLKKTFHRQNLTRRLLIMAVVAALITGLTWSGFWPGLLMFTGYMVYAVLLFGYLFTIFLNQERQLNPWYISVSPTAANTDKFVVWLAGKMNKTPEKTASIIYPTGFVIGFIVYITTFFYVYHY
jgi:ABC-type Fe3+-siderophore transport system permease subunit